MSVDDGIVFDPESVTAEEIRGADEYDGVRARLEARIAEARIPVQVDVGFGDAVNPPPMREAFPTLLGDEPPRIFVYPRETVVAEKLEAIVSLGATNSRMKDFYDVHRLASSFVFDGKSLAHAVRATFEQRKTPFSDREPFALRLGFLAAPDREVQWRAFLRRGRLRAVDAEQLTNELRRFLLPVLEAASEDATFEARWPPGGPWESRGAIRDVRAPFGGQPRSHISAVFRSTSRSSWAVA